VKISKSAARGKLKRRGPLTKRDTSGERSAVNAERRIIFSSTKLLLPNFICSF
jgi:hypothetical protein